MISSARLSVLFLVCMALASCSEPVAQIDSPSVHAKDRLEFSYPANWKITEDSAGDDERTITVDSSGSALVFLHIAEATALGFPTHVKTFSKAMVENMPGYFKRDAGTLGAPGTWKDYDSVSESFRGNIPYFAKEEFTIVYRCKAIGEKTVFAFMQIMKADESRVMSGFDLILSLLKLEASE